MTSASPIVSVIIATYNRSSVLRYAIQSVLWQTCQDFELLVIGDACTDDSAEVVGSFQDSRIRWYNLPQNSGNQSVPNNTGLEMAHGTYVAYLGHDDLWYPTHLDLLLRRIQESGADVVYSLCDIIGEPGSGTKFVTGISATGQYERGLLVPPSSILHRRDMVHDTGSWKDYRTIKLPPDTEFLVRAHDCGKRFAAARELTVIKPPSALRQNVYVERPSYEQAEYARRIQSEPDFLYRELLDIVATYLFQRAPFDSIIEVPDSVPAGWLVEQLRKKRGLNPLIRIQHNAGMIRRLVARLPRSLRGRLRRAAKTVVHALRD